MEVFDAEAEAGEATWDSARVLPGAGDVYRRQGKRVLDIALGLPLCLIATPLIFLLAMLVIACDGWPAFHRGKRLGKDGREFSMWKLRTMLSGSEAQLQEWADANPRLAEEYARHFKLREDPRITRLGRLLRRSSLDELPQLWNVVKGDMSLVGPRPIVRDELCNYGDRAAELLSMRPGLTGAWQVNSRNGVSYPLRAQHELDYCSAASLAADLRIIAVSLLVPFRFNGL